MSKSSSYSIVNAHRLKAVLRQEPGELDKWLESMPEKDVKEAILELIKIEKKEAIAKFEFNKSNKYSE